MAWTDFFRFRADGRAVPAAPKILPMEQPKRFDPTGGAKKGTLAALVGVSVAVALGVFIPQEESGRKTEASVAADGSLIVKHISGKQYVRAYLDAVGVATACDGITHYRGRKVKMGDHFTEAQCTEMLEGMLIEHAGPVMKCTPGIALGSDPATEKRREGPRFTAISLGMNIGVAGYCGSTSAKRFNAGDYKGGCEAATWWVRAGKRVLPGLVTRRGLENNVCLNGLSAKYRRS